MADNPKIDEVTGVEIVGHEWDGIAELNNPLPRWWVWVFLATILWAIGYWIVMPAWPLVSGYTKGVLGYSQRAKVARQLREADAAKAKFADRIRAGTPESIRANQELLSFALAGGRSAYAVNCSPCHGAGAAGSKGYPNLNDDAWLWGGTLKDIYQTIRFGIRSGNENARVNDMPAFLKDDVLKKAQINDVAEYVLSLSGRSKNAAAAKRGAALFKENCVACHGENAKGNPELGAPDLTDAIWLYGGDKDTIVQTISFSRRGVMPAWEGRLDPVTLKMLAVYVHSLGGGRSAR